MSVCIHWPPQKITRSETLFMTQWSHYQAVFIHHSLSSSDQNQISRLGRFGILPHQRCHRVCVFVCARVELDKQEQYDDAVTPLPLLEVSASAYEGGNSAIWCFLHWQGSLLMSPMPIWPAQWEVWLMGGWPTLFGISDYVLLQNSSPLSFTLVKVSPSGYPWSSDFISTLVAVPTYPIFTSINHYHIHYKIIAADTFWSLLYF